MTDAVLPILRRFRTCLVCPERWGRPKDIPEYRQMMANVGFEPDAVMTSLDTVEAWIAGN